jgi:hypothetical protein
MLKATNRDSRSSAVRALEHIQRAPRFLRLQAVDEGDQRGHGADQFGGNLFAQVTEGPTETVAAERQPRQ